MWKADTINIKLEDGYTLKGYETIKTEDGYDLIFSFEEDSILEGATSYFANIKNLPNNFIPIAICGKAPDGWDGLCYKRLAPKWEFFKVWKDNHDNF